MYDPKVGRFLSLDPSGIDGGLNFYEYAKNDPINWDDPDGLAPETTTDTRQASALKYLADFGVGAYGATPNQAIALSYGVLLSHQRAAQMNADAAIRDFRGAQTVLPGMPKPDIQAPAILQSQLDATTAAVNATESVIKDLGLDQVSLNGVSFGAGGELIPLGGAGLENLIQQAYRAEHFTSHGLQSTGDEMWVIAGLAKAALPALDAASAKALSGGGSFSLFPAARMPIRAGQLTTLQDFVDRSVVGDNLEGHELLQHANLKAQGLATERLSTAASQNNPVVALDRAIHIRVNVAQSAIDAAGQTSMQNIAANAALLRNMKILPASLVDKLEAMAMKHARSLED